MKKRILTILTIAAAFVSCSKSDEGVSDGGSTMMVSIEPTVATRATELSFEDGDQIGISILRADGSTLYADNELMSYLDGSFQGSLAWYSDSDESSTLMAYYPYSSVATPSSFTVLSDQSGDGYTNSDLMAASKSDVAPTESAVSMTFKHQLTRIIVEVDNQTEGDISSIQIGGSYPTASFDLETQSVEVDNSSATVDIVTNQISDTKYQAIIIPQTVSLSIIVVVDGETISQSQSLAELSPSAQYTAKITLVQGDISVEFGGEIENWEDDGEITPAPDSGSVSFVDYPEEERFVYDDVEYKTVTLENGTRWMACNLRYIPEGFTVSADPSANSEIWYPYDFTSLEALTDEDSIDANGYLYTVYAAFGKSVEQSTEIEDFEGAQGICPDGWHIPSRIEWYDLVGRSNSNKYIGEGTSAKLNEDALFYDASTQYGSKTLANDAGFNLTDSGVRMMTSFTSTGKYQGYNLSYYMSSTFYYNQYSTTAGDSYGSWTNAQFFAPMIYSDGRVMLAYCSVESGSPVRCVKDSDKVYTEIEADSDPVTRPTSDNPSGL